METPQGRYPAVGLWQPSGPFNFFGHAWLASSASSVPDPAEGWGDVRAGREDP